jgi:Cu/Ag efflux pump CusA
VFVVEPGDALDRRGVHDREIQLLVRGAERVEQVEDLLHDPVRARAGPVDLVDDDDRVQAAGKGLAGDKACLGHGTVHRVHQQQHRVDHGQHTLHFTAEVRVPRRIDDVDAVVP